MNVPVGPWYCLVLTVGLSVFNNSNKVFQVSCKIICKMNELIWSHLSSNCPLTLPL